MVKFLRNHQLDAIPDSSIYSSNEFIEDKDRTLHSKNSYIKFALRELKILLQTILFFLTSVTYKL